MMKTCCPYTEKSSAVGCERQTRMPLCPSVIIWGLSLSETRIREQVDFLIEISLQIEIAELILHLKMS